MKKTLFLTAILGAAFAAPAMADTDVYNGPDSYGHSNSYYLKSSGNEVASAEDYTLDLSSLDSFWLVPEDATTSLTVNKVLTKDGASANVGWSGWDDSKQINVLTIKELAASGDDATLSLNIQPASGKDASSMTVAINNVSGTLSSVTNAGVLTLGTADTSTTTLSGTATNSGTLTLLGTVTFDVSSLAGYSQTGSSSMSAPEAGTNGFESGTATYALISNSGTVDATGATVTTTAGDTISTTDGTMTITKTGTGTKYYIQDGSSVALSTIQGEGSVTDVVVSSGTLELDATGVGLNKITGAGNVTVTTATSLTGSLASAATGTLTVSNATLTVGTSDGQTNSLTSFTAVNLAGGTITYQNKKDTLNNVTVASDSTGVINSIDMGNAAGDTLTLAGTTTVGGELTIQNLWNAQFAINKLTGDGTLSIKGTNGGDSSSEAATYTLGDTSTFTGTLDIGNSKATVSQTFSTIEAMTADLTYTVTGGTVVKTCAAGISGDTNLGAASGTISGAVTGGTITGGTGDITLSGAISDATINGNDKVTIASSTISDSTLNDVKFGGTQRKNISGTVTIGDATNEATGGTYNYALVGSGNLVITGTADLTKNAAGEDNAFGAIGMGSGSMITVKDGASLTASRIYNSTSSNADVTVEEGGTLTLNGTANSVIVNMVNNGTADLGSADTSITSLTNSGSLTIGGATTINTVTLNGGTITLGTTESHDNDLTLSDLTVNKTSTINANLVMGTGTITFAQGATVTLGCTLDLGENTKIVLTAEDVATLDANGNVTLFTSVEGLGDYLTNGGLVWIYSATDPTVATTHALAFDAATGTVYATPEPATATLSLLALAGLCARRRRRA